MNHVEPLVPFPSQISRAVLVRAGPDQQLWRASFRGERVALRLARVEEPLFSPPEIIARAANLASELRLVNTAELIATSRIADGFFVAERWIEGEPLGLLPELETLRLLRGVAQDLTKLHSARKWHGGVRPSRVVIGRRSAHLTAYSWSAFLTTLPRDQFAPLSEGDRQEYAPELLAHGPKAAGPALDVFGFARVLQAAVKSPSRHFAGLLERATSPDPKLRPTMRELAYALT